MSFDTVGAEGDDDTHHRAVAVGEACTAEAGVRGVDVVLIAGSREPGERGARIVLGEVGREGHAFGGHVEVGEEAGQARVVDEVRQQRLETHLVAQTPKPLAHVLGVEAAAFAIFAHGTCEERERSGQRADADLLAALHVRGGDVIEEDRLGRRGIMRRERERIARAATRDQKREGAQAPVAARVHVAVDAFVVPHPLQHAREPRREDHRRHRLAARVPIAGRVKCVDAGRGRVAVVAPGHDAVLDLVEHRALGRVQGRHTRLRRARHGAPACGVACRADHLEEKGREVFTDVAVVVALDGLHLRGGGRPVRDRALQALADP